MKSRGATSKRNRKEGLPTKHKNLKSSNNAKIWLANAEALTTRCKLAVNTRDASIIKMCDIYMIVYLDSEKGSLESRGNRSFAIASRRRWCPCDSETGFGKSLINQVFCLAKQFSNANATVRILLISPLNSIVEDQQVGELTKLGLPAVYNAWQIFRNESSTSLDCEQSLSS